MQVAPERFTANTVTAADISFENYLSGTKELNFRLYNASRVFLPYCTQDLSIGAQAWNDARSFPRSNGFSIVIEIIRFLMTVLPQPDQVLFSGASSGGLGIVPHVYSLMRTSLFTSGAGYFNGTNVRLLLDSSMFFNHRGIMTNYLQTHDLGSFYHMPLISSSFKAVSNLTTAPAWQEEYFSAFAELCNEQDEELGVPSCMGNCALRKVLDWDVPTLVMMSRYDPTVPLFGLQQQLAPFDRFSSLLNLPPPATTKESQPKGVDAVCFSD
eukprot:m.13075 g.13075  ORF g.13075 m.13075 type:complete len:269 (-) comp10089_c0_seq2:2564-3370(-)